MKISPDHLQVFEQNYKLRHHVLEETLLRKQKLSFAD